MFFSINTPRVGGRKKTNLSEKQKLELNLKARDDGTLIQLFTFWALSIVLLLFKTAHNVSEIGFCLCLRLGPIERASPYLRK
jgi:hypothetical protein